MCTGDQAETMCLISLALIYLRRECKLSELKGCHRNPVSFMDPPGCALHSDAYVLNRRIYSTRDIF